MGSKRKLNAWKRASFLLLIMGILIGGLAGILLQNQFKVLQDDITPTNINKEVVYEEGAAYVRVPAVDENGEGVSTLLMVKAEPGTGKTLVDIDSLLFWVDTQNSIRMAKLVAENVTGLDTDKYDMTFSIAANASLIGGESAGAALALASIAALKGEDLRQDVMITGTINHDGTIGPIGGVLEKAQAAESVGATTFLVPLLQSSEITYLEQEHCEKFGLMEWCSIERIPKKVDVQEEVGIDVVEVGNIKEAYQYFKTNGDS